jgi:hypothetical protein
MNTDEIISLLKDQREALNEAITALNGASRSGRPPGKKRHMSAAARRKISQAQKKRWAAQRKKNA